MIPCKQCSQSAIYINYSGRRTDGTTACYGENGIEAIPCRFCNGKGWIDEDEIISVPRKYVKDEYFKNLI
jgi:hypothetical protein